MQITRDVLGLEPLYYWAKDPSIHGRTVLELLERGVPRKLSRAGFWSYMFCGSVQEPFTLIEDVYSLPPGWILNTEAQRHRDPQSRFEKSNNQTIKQSNNSPDWTRASAQEAVTAAVEQAVRTTLEKNGGTPCAFLSGGIDSGALVAVMRNVLGKDAEIRTCCVIHEDPRTDERQWARLTAERNHTRHEEFLLTGEMFVKLIGEALDCYDQPSVDGINSYIASKFASGAGFQNILSGEGGDELFAGYGQFANPRRAYAVARKLSAFGLRGTALGRFFGRTLTRCATKEKFKKLGQLMASDYDPYFLTRRQFDPDWIARLVGQDFNAEAQRRRGPQRPTQGTPSFNAESQSSQRGAEGFWEWRSTGFEDAGSISDLYATMQRAMGTDVDFGTDIINRCSWMETRHNLLSMYVRDGIQTSAPFGLNIELPLLSKELMKLLFTIPGALKCDPKMSKPLLVGAAKGGLPEACVFKKKQGFALPFDRYFKTVLRPQFEAFVTTGGTHLFRQSELARIWRLYLAGKTSWMRIWQPYVLDHWLHRHQVQW